MVTDKDGCKRYVPVDIEVHQSSPSVETTPQKPKRTGGLAIFFRKVEKPMNCFFLIYANTT